MTDKPPYEELKKRVRELEDKIAEYNTLEARLADLEESEKTYRHMFDTAMVGMYRTRIEDGKVLAANKAWAEMMGYDSVDQFKSEFVASDRYADSDCRQEVLKQLRLKGKIDAYEVEMIRKDGSIIPIAISGTLYPEQGYLEGFVIDITGRRQAERSLRESEERFRSLAELLPEAVYEMDIDGKLTFLNRTALDRLGYTREDFERGLYGNDMIAPSDRNRITENITKMINGEKLGLVEYRALKKDGSTYPVLSRSAVIIKDGEPVGLRGFVIDISERKKMEEKLRESEAKYRQLVQHAPVGIYEFDMENLKFFSVNDVMCEYLGYTEAELLKLNPLELMVGDDRKKLKMRREDVVVENRNPPPTEFTIRGKNKREFRVLVNSKTFFENGKPKKSLVVAHDLTEIRKAEEEKKNLEARLHQAQKMESLGTLAGGIAHDFNNLLMGIQGNASLMLLDYDSNHRHFSKLKNIEEYVQRGANLTSQLLGLARSGKYEIRSTDLNVLVQSSSEMFNRTRKEITIHRKFQDDIWIVGIDRGQIGQVLLNIFINAWQAMHGGGDLYIETENVFLNEDYVRPYSVQPGKYVKISIADTGIGMEDSVRQRVFDPFFTTREIGRGTGLGLASSYGIVRNHDGIITVESDLGKGSTFCLYFPVSENTAIQEKAVSRNLVKGNEKILFIDDEEMVIDVGKHMLDRLGYEVVTANSGREAVEIFRSNYPSIEMVILDMIMPDMGGGETFDQLKDINPQVRVLLSSGYSINGQATEILNRAVPDSSRSRLISMNCLKRSEKSLTPECGYLVHIEY